LFSFIICFLFCNIILYFIIIFLFKADIVFDDDKGFYETIQSLAREARKPIILTSSTDRVLDYFRTEDVTIVNFPPHQQVS